MLESHGWVKYQSGEYLFRKEDIKTDKEEDKFFQHF